MARMFSTEQNGDDKTKNVLDFIKALNVVAEPDAAVAQTDVDLNDIQVDFERTDGSELHANTELPEDLLEVE
jgi:hypothetical protein